MNRFLSEIQGKYTKLTKIVKISICFNRLVFPVNLTDSQPLDIDTITMLLIREEILEFVNSVDTITLFQKSVDWEFVC